MKLYVKDKTTNKRILLDINEPNRNALRYRLGSNYFQVRGQTYSINDVMAYADNSDTMGGLILGSIIGLFAGPVGVALGGTAGGFVGRMKDNEAKEKAQRFNEELVL